MNYFVPMLSLKPSQNPNLGVHEKLGGSPHGLPLDKVPVCKCCSTTMTLIAQFAHDKSRLDLIIEGSALFVFYCTNTQTMCPTWRHDSGATACFIVSPEELVSELLGSFSHPVVPMEAEVTVDGWIAQEDLVDRAQMAAFESETEFRKLPTDLRESVSPYTKFGSAPRWIQGTSDDPGKDWVFLGQLDSDYSFYRKDEFDFIGGSATVRFSNGVKRKVWRDEGDDHGRFYHCRGPLFGDAGRAFIFRKKDAGGTVPDCKFILQSF